MQRLIEIRDAYCRGLLTDKEYIQKLDGVLAEFVECWNHLIQSNYDEPFKGITFREFKNIVDVERIRCVVLDGDNEYSNIESIEFNNYEVRHVDIENCITYERGYGDGTGDITIQPRFKVYLSYKGEDYD